jgi:hypothetical protein
MASEGRGCVTPEGLTTTTGPGYNPARAAEELEEEEEKEEEEVLREAAPVPSQACADAASPGRVSDRGRASWGASKAPSPLPSLLAASKDHCTTTRSTV